MPAVNGNYAETASEPNSKNKPFTSSHFVNSNENLILSQAHFGKKIGDTDS
jgi:hypothetical protein